VTADLLVVLNKSDHEAALVDPASLRTIAKLPTGQGPHEVAVSPDGHLAYVSNYGMFGVFREGERRDHPGNTISVLDLRRRVVRDTFELGNYTRPHGIWVSRDGRRVSNARSNAVTVFDAKTRGRLANIEVGAVPIGIQMSPDGKRAFIANTNDDKVTVIGVASRKVEGAFRPGSEPDGMAWATRPGS